MPPPARYAKNGEPVYDKREFENLHRAAAAASGKTIWLNKRQMDAVCDAIVETAVKYACDGIVAVAKNHVHVLVKFPPKMTTGFFCNRVKSKSSLRLSDHGLKGKVGARRYHAKRIKKDGVKHAFNYVKNHCREGAVTREF